MENIIIILIIAAIVGSAVYYIYKERKMGKKCIGCPYAEQCGGKCHGSDNAD